MLELFFHPPLAPFPSREGNIRFIGMELKQSLHTYEKSKCPDCHYCQGCNKTRCRVCRQGSLEKAPSLLGSAFTYGQYLQWKNNRITCDRFPP